MHFQITHPLKIAFLFVVAKSVSERQIGLILSLSAAGKGVTSFRRAMLLSNVTLLKSLCFFFNKQK